MRHLLLASILVVPVLLSARGIGSESLAGIKTVSVVVEKLPTEINPYLTENQLRVDVELRLRKAGITVRDTAEPSDADLYVNVTLVHGRRWAYNVSVEVMQDVVLPRNQLQTRAATWHKSVVGLFSVSDDAAQNERIIGARLLHRHCGDSVDEFLNDYLSVNPLK